MLICLCSLCKCLYFSRFLYKHLQIWSQSHQIYSPTFSLKTNGTGPQPVVVFTVSCWLDLCWGIDLERLTGFRPDTWQFSKSGREFESTRVENVTRWKIIQQQDPSTKSWRFGSSSDVFLFFNWRDVFCFSRWFFGIGTSKFSQRDPQKKRHVVIFPSCLEFFVVRLSVSRDQISTPRPLMNGVMGP